MTNDIRKRDTKITRKLYSTRQNYSHILLIIKGQCLTHFLDLKYNSNCINMRIDGLLIHVVHKLQKHVQSNTWVVRTFYCFRYGLRVHVYINTYRTENPNTQNRTLWISTIKRTP